MDRETLISYASSFTSFLLDAKISKKIDRIILFGSVARGDFDRESDIDIFIDSNEDMDKAAERVLSLFRESETFRKWRLKGVKNDISLKTGKLEKWSLRRNVISNGIVLYGKYNEMPQDASYYLMLRLRLGKMDRNKKIQFWRKLYGYTQKIGTKKYKSQGLIEKLGGRKLGKSIITVPMERKKEILGFLKKNKVDCTLNEIWSDNL